MYLTFGTNSNSIILARDGKLATLEILKVGEWKSKSHGNFTITREMLEEAIVNFNNNIHRLTDEKGEPQIPLNFSHNEGDLAAGWIKKLELNESKTVLIAGIDLTPIGREKAENKEFIFSSSEFSFVYFDPELNQKFKNVLTGVALTNIPFVRGMDSIKLTQKKEDMEEILKLAMNLTDEEKVILFEKFKDMAKSIKGSEHENDKDKKLSKKTDPDQLKLSNRITSLEKELQTSKKEHDFTVLLAEGKVVPAQKEAYLTNNINEMIKNSAKSDMNFNQQSSSGNQGKKSDKIDTKEKAEDEAIKLAEKACKEDDSLSFTNAVKKVLAEDENLSNLYKGK